MKTIFSIASGLDQHHHQKFNNKQNQLFNDFLNEPNKYTANAQKIIAISHMDGAMERWQVQLDENYWVFIDCNIPYPWGTSDGVNSFFGMVLIAGYQIGDEIFLNSN